MSSGHKWKRLQRAVALPASEALIQAWMQQFGTREKALEALEEEQRHCELWRNDLYQVQVHELEGGWRHLNIRRVDGYPGRDWRHFQQIKNELVGPECEAVEIYPAESRLVDQGNKYHLYCCTDPEYRIPFGWQKRDVRYDQYNEGGLRQRPPMQFADAK
jgi:hypothetical protein